MSLTTGQRLGVYEVTAAIGAGGMGEVYRAHDTTLNRDVAIKVLPDAFADDPERLARFQREAEVLASLNHPNIAQIHGLEESDGVRALVLELVEGPTLADRIAQGAIPLDEALPIAKQIAEGLEAAHEAGVIHRDLKPANIKVTPDGVVKILDFGLAKALEPERSDEDAANSPTRLRTGYGGAGPDAATRAGVIMGTAAYMSPEQARGKQVDKRADIWAFGCVLYEMLTGQRAFPGADVSETLASVLAREPDWNTLPAATPQVVRKLLRRCLERDRANRLHDAGDARIEIVEVLTATVPDADGPPVPATTHRWWQQPVPALLGPVLLVAVTGLAVWSLTRPTDVAPAPVGRFSLMSPGSEAVRVSDTQQDVAVSPDGTTVVYVVGQGTIETAAMMVRSLDRLTGQPLDATRAAFDLNPFMSPDNAWVGFYDFTARALRKVSIQGGPAITIAELDSNLRGASWAADDTVIFGSEAPSGLWRAPAGGGEPEVITTVDSAGGEFNHGWPDVLPGSRAVLFTILTNDSDTTQIAVVDLATGEHRVLVPAGQAPRYAATGHLVYATAGTLRAVGFDLDTLEVISNPVPVVDGVVTKSTGAANFDLSENGSLVYVPGGATAGSNVRRTLVWVDRHGNEQPLAAEPRAYQYVRISPDGTRIALDARNEENDIWLWDDARQALTRLTFAEEGDEYPVWTSDGQRVAFSSTRAGSENLFWKAADGTGTVERLTEVPYAQVPHAFTPDDSHLVFRQDGSDTIRDLAVLSMDDERSSELLLATEFAEFNAELSPDGRWLAYQSNASGQVEVYVQPFPHVDQGRWQVSTTGGFQPLWGPDGRELFYRVQGGGVSVVTVETESGFSFGASEVVFEGNYTFVSPIAGRTFDIAPDGQRFLMLKEAVETDVIAAERHVVVVQNWTEELKRLVPTP